MNQWLWAATSLLSLEQMRHPFAYKLKVQEGDAMVERVVDVVETFNYLLGLDVKKLRQFRDGERLYRATLAEQRNQKSAVVIWRDLEGLEEDATALQRDAKFIEQDEGGCARHVEAAESVPKFLLIFGGLEPRRGLAIGNHRPQRLDNHHGLVGMGEGLSQ